MGDCFATVKGVNLLPEVGPWQIYIATLMVGVLMKKDYTP
jgi:hypothetical protein